MLKRSVAGELRINHERLISERSVDGGLAVAIDLDLFDVYSYPSSVGPETLPSRSVPAAASTAIAAKQSVNLKSSSGASSREAVVAVAEVEAPLKKKQDLSGVAPAAKKRRALAACKKPDTRKFARAGSESKCTESVMKGDYDNIIEALEYGR